MDAGRRAAELLDRRPELEEAVEAVLAVDAREEEWTFDDVPIDSGAFGELVAEGVVVDAEGSGYQVAEPEAVRAVLADEDVSDGSDTPDRDLSGWLGERFGTVDRGVVALFGVTLGFLVVVRSYLFQATFRGEHVVLSGNDPYLYRYLVDTVLASGGAGIGQLAELSGRVSAGEPMLVFFLSLVSSLVGGADAVGGVLAVYPVLAAVIAAGLLYTLSVRVTDDRRVGFASIAMLAIVPGHAFRTSLGYADHHAFDYVWLILTALALVVLLDTRSDRSLRRRRTWGLISVLVVGVVGQILAWEGGPLLLLPIAFVIAGRGLLAVHDDRSPIADALPLLVGLWIAGVVTLISHAALGWQSTTVASAPLLVAVGGTGVIGISEVTARIGRSAQELLIAETMLGGIAIVGSWLAIPNIFTAAVDVFALVTREGTTAEARALFDAATLGFFLIFGPFLLVVAVAFMLWAVARILDGDETVLVPTIYAWFFFILTLFQVRFVGELAPFAALFAGLGFVWLAAWVDLAALPPSFASADTSFRSWVPSRPTLRMMGYVLALFILIAGIGLVQSAIKVEQLSYDDETYNTAAWMEDYAQERGWETREESYVFSRWPVNRMFNYFVNGNAGSYGTARSLYGGFIERTDEEIAYNSLRSQVTFIVTRNRSADPPTMQALLHERYGSDSGRFAGSGHFRAMYTSKQGTLKVFLPVEGALITGTTTSNASVTLIGDVSIQGASFPYERQTSANATGDFELRVAYPGTYTVDSEGDTWEVDVAEEAIEGGERVQIGS